jgi:predicted DCC family thiol-disulfide oxidoreductase YuxK
VPNPILLYDGVCGLCNRLVQFILRHDRKAVFRFAALQSPLASRVLARHGADANDLDTVYVIQNYDTDAASASQSHAPEALLVRSSAIVFIFSQLGGLWSFAGAVLSVLPLPLRDWGYNRVARNRYRIFGRYNTCPLPSAETRSRFLDT